MTERATRNSRYIAILASVSAAILIAGALLRPAPDTTTSAAPPPSETDLQRLARLSQRRSLESMTAYFSYVADGAARSLAFIPDAGVTGVAWGARTIIAPRIDLASPEAATVIAAGMMHRARTDVRGPHLPIVALETTDAHALVEPPRGSAPAAAGDWLVALWQTASGRAFAPGTFLEIVPATCERRPVREMLTSLTLTPAMSGSALVDADGRLLAIVLPCGDRFAAIEPADVDAMIEAGRSLEGRLLAAWGFVADRLTPDEATFFKADDGVIVREVWNGLPADRAGLRPGDILRAIDAQPPATLESLHALAAADQATLTVARGARTAAIALGRNDVALSVDADTVPVLGFVWSSPAPGYRIESVLAESAAARAGIRSGDVLLRIDRVEPTSMTHVRRLLAARRTSPAFIELQRGERRWGVLLQ